MFLFKHIHTRRRSPGPKKRKAQKPGIIRSLLRLDICLPSEGGDYSHSIVAGGLEEMS